MSTLWWEIWCLEHFLEEPGPFPTPLDPDDTSGIVAPMFQPRDLAVDELADRFSAQQVLISQLVATSWDRIWPHPDNVRVGVDDPDLRRDVTKAFGERLEHALQAVRSELDRQ